MIKVWILIRKVTGRQVKVVINADGKPRAVLGWIKNVTATGVELEFKNKESKLYSWPDIISGKLEIEIK
ncbi:MAG: hypothetical protein HY920_03655 [Elusimicrobia bacterium]|nr:hypothetical protein [Elusimicrobiota bacterium]